ncbi:MAG: hypothetical protein LBL58_10165, partial [Tannerellaceae bacterium]|nr:hypothetical protein [Tannerellaceae bacterium]
GRRKLPGTGFPRFRAGLWPLAPLGYPFPGGGGPFDPGLFHRTDPGEKVGAHEAFPKLTGFWNKLKYYILS